MTKNHQEEFEKNPVLLAEKIKGFRIVAETREKGHFYSFGNDTVENILEMYDIAAVSCVEESSRGGKEVEKWSHRQLRCLIPRLDEHDIAVFYVN